MIEMFQNNRLYRTHVEEAMARRLNIQSIAKRYRNTAVMLEKKNGS